MSIKKKVYFKSLESLNKWLSQRKLIYRDHSPYSTHKYRLNKGRFQFYGEMSDKWIITIPAGKIHVRRGLGLRLHTGYPHQYDQYDSGKDRQLHFHEDVKLLKKQLP